MWRKILLVILFTFHANKDITSDVNPTDNAQIQDEDTINTESQDSQITDETPSCAPIYTGGKTVSHTSTDITCSFCFSEATCENVLEYIHDVKGNDW